MDNTSIGLQSRARPLESFMAIENANREASSRANSYPSWSPRFWHGMRTADWWRLLAKNRFNVHLSRLHIAVGVSAFTPVNDVMAALQWMAFGRKIRRAKVEKAPIFILGHWRSGTTFLHELMVTNPKFASPTTFQCFAPSHHLVSEYLMVRYGGFLLPKKRPMDEMEAGWSLPQEDEFALMNLGIASPYLRIAFPKSQSKEMEYFSLDELSETDLSRWREAFTWFLRTLSVRYKGRQLVLKSPPHTGRLSELAKLYPDAKFIHLTRDPRKLYLSTLRLWKSLDEVQSLQISPGDELKGYVCECMKAMYRSFQRARESVSSERIIDIRYEDLVDEPIETMQKIYSELQLGSFQDALPALKQRLVSHESYQPNKHRAVADIDQETLAHWNDYGKRYGYWDSSYFDTSRPSDAT